MQLEAVEPIHRGFAALRDLRKDLMRRDATVVTNRNRQRVNEGDADRLAFTSL